MCYNFGENAGMMELVDMRDLGDVTSVKGFITSADS